MSFSYLSLLVVHSGHWYQGNRACQVGLVPQEVLGGRSDPAHQAVRVLFGLTQKTGRGSGSIWSYNETSGLQQEGEESHLK